MDIAKTYRIAAPATDVWQALTDPGVIERWSGWPAVMAERAGFEFSLWGGDVHGTVTEVVTGRRLVEQWFGEGWREPSLAVFELASDEEGTTLTLSQTGVPDDEGADFAEGWDEYYLGPIKELLEA